MIDFENDRYQLQDTVTGEIVPKDKARMLIALFRLEAKKKVLDDDIKLLVSELKKREQLTYHIVIVYIVG